MRRSHLAILAFFVTVFSCKEESILPPKACADIPVSSSHGATTSFDASCSTNAELYSWSFGDGVTATGITTTHIYDTPGKYSVKLIVESSGMKDSITQVIDIGLSASQKSCLLSKMRSVELWPSSDVDSVVVVYLQDRKVDELQWRAKTGANSSKIMSRIKFNYDANGRPSVLETYEQSGQKFVIQTITYNAAGLPEKNVSKYAGSLFIQFVGTYIHDDKGRIATIEYRTSEVQTDKPINRLRFEYNTNGNLTKAFSTYVFDERERVIYERNGFNPSLVPWYGSAELRFYMEYIAAQGSRKNFETGGKYYSTVYPGSRSYDSFGNLTPDGPGWTAGFTYTTNIVTNQQTKLVTSFVAGTDSDFYDYKCF